MICPPPIEFKFHESRDLFKLCILSTWFIAPSTVPHTQEEDKKCWMNEWMTNPAVTLALKGPSRETKHNWQLPDIGLWRLLTDLRNTGVEQGKKAVLQAGGKISDCYLNSFNLGGLIQGAGKCFSKGMLYHSAPLNPFIQIPGQLIFF